MTIKSNLSRQEIDDVKGQINDMSIEQLDEVVDHIRAIYKAKRNLASAQKKSTMMVGTKVRFGRNTRPNYLANQKGEIVDIRQTRVTVKLDAGPMGKFKSGKVIANPTSLEVI